MDHQVLMDQISLNFKSEDTASCRRYTREDNNYEEKKKKLHICFSFYRKIINSI